MFAAKEGHLKIVHQLISAGADIFIKDEVCTYMYFQHAIITDLYSISIVCNITE